jgi:hypothetical protein
MPVVQLFLANTRKMLVKRIYRMVNEAVEASDSAGLSMAEKLDTK